MGYGTRLGFRIIVRVRFIVEFPSQKVESHSLLVEPLTLVAEPLSLRVEVPSLLVEPLSQVVEIRSQVVEPLTFWSSCSLVDFLSSTFDEDFALDLTRLEGMTCYLAQVPSVCSSTLW